MKLSNTIAVGDDVKFSSSIDLANALFAKCNQIRRINDDFKSGLTNIIEFICWVNEQGHLVNEYVATNGNFYSFSEVKLLGVFKPLVAPRSITVGANPRLQCNLKNSVWHVGHAAERFMSPDEMLSIQEALCGALRITIDDSSFFTLSEVRTDVALEASGNYSFEGMWFCSDTQRGTVPVPVTVRLYESRVANDSVQVALSEYVNLFYDNMRKVQVRRV